MSALKPVDHQNIVLRLLARSAPCGPKHLVTLAHSYKLPVSLHEIRVACDALVEQEFAERYFHGYRLSTWGECELPAVPLLESYYVEHRHRTVCRAAEQRQVTEGAKGGASHAAD